MTFATIPERLSPKRIAHIKMLEAMQTRKECKRCQKRFVPRASNALYCSMNCRKGTQEKPFSYGLATSTVGTIGELMVSVELLRLGFEVFRALSPACSSDLLLHKGGMAYRVEVKTTHYRADGRVNYPGCTIRAENLILVTHCDQKVHLPNEFIPIQEGFTEMKANKRSSAA